MEVSSNQCAFSLEDVNGDGVLDRIFFFSTSDLASSGALDGTSSVAEVTGMTLLESCAVAGRDSIRIVSEAVE